MNLINSFKRITNNIVIKAIQIPFITFPISFFMLLGPTNSHKGAYIITSIIGIILCILNIKNKNTTYSKHQLIIIYFSSIIFASLCILANYDCFFLVFIPAIIQKIFLFIGEFLIFSNILKWLYNYLKNKNISNNQISSKAPFLRYFLIFLIIYSFILFTCYYPGHIGYDSYSQIDQILNNTYIQHHPIMHTFFMEIFINIGINIFDDLYIAIALYSFIQIVIVSASFAYCIMTMKQVNVNKKLIIFSILFFIVLPFQIIYSFNLVKDTLFGSAMLVFIVSLYRILYNIPNYKKISYILITISSLAICLFKGSGLGIFLLTFIFLIIMFKRKHIHILIIFFVVLILSSLWNYKLINYFNFITGFQTTESLALPIQQVARVISEDKKISKDEKDLIEQIITIKELKELYYSRWYDNIKFNIYSNQTEEIFNRDKQKYFKLWLNLGLKYPNLYIEAWVDLTNGYWNPKSVYVSVFSMDDSIYIDDSIKFFNVSIIKNLFNKYISIFEKSNILGLTYNVGFYVWIIFILSIIILLSNKKRIIFLIPIYALLISIYISVPKDNEFRYAYPIFTCFPFLVFTSINKKNYE